MRWLIPTFFASILLPFIPTRAIDGDTFTGLAELRPGLFEVETIRMNCPTPDGGYFNTPELRADGGGHKEQQALTSFLSRTDAGYLLLTDWKRDKYGRTLGEPGVLNGSGFCTWDGGQ